MRAGRLLTDFTRYVFVLGSAAVADAVSRPGRNQLCACGSGRKSKRCCGGSADSPRLDAQGSFFRVAGLLAAVMLLVGSVAVVRSLVYGDDDGSHRVWSAEHGHWHGSGAKDGTNSVAPGKVWNQEHGHFHNGPDLDHQAKPHPGALEDRARAEVEAASAKAAAAAN